MDIPASTTDSSLFTLQAGRELLAAMQAPDPATPAPVAFDQVLESTLSITDVVEIGTPAQTAALDPTSSALFQAHSGALSANQAMAATSDTALALEQSSRLKVMGVDASSAAGPFANGQSPQPEDLQADLTRLNVAEASRYAAVTGASEFSETYNALFGAERMNPPIGTHLDMKG